MYLFIYLLIYLFIYEFLYISHYFLQILLQTTTMKKSTLDNISVFLAELIGTGLLVMLGCMGCVSGLGHTPSHFELCINFGLIVMIIVQIFGCVSGSHLNPAVTAAAWVYELVSTKVGALFLIFCHVFTPFSSPN